MPPVATYLLDRLCQHTGGNVLPPCYPDKELWPEQPQERPFQVPERVLSVAFILSWQVQMYRRPDAETQRQDAGEQD